MWHVEGNMGALLHLCEFTSIAVTLHGNSTRADSSRCRTRTS